MLNASDEIEYKMISQVDDAIDIEEGVHQIKSRSKWGLCRLTIAMIAFMLLIGFSILTIIPMTNSNWKFMFSGKNHSNIVQKSNTTKSNVIKLDWMKPNDENDVIKILSNNTRAKSPNKPVTSIVEPSAFAKFPSATIIRENKTTPNFSTSITKNLSKSKKNNNPPLTTDGSIISKEIISVNTTHKSDIIIPNESFSISSTTDPLKFKNYTEIPIVREGNINVKGLLSFNHPNKYDYDGHFKENKTAKKIGEDINAILTRQVMWIMAGTVLSIISIFACFLLCLMCSKKGSYGIGTTGWSDVHEADKVELLNSNTID